MEHYRLLGAVAALTILATLWVARKATSPVARIPGTFWSKFSVLPLVYHDFKSNRTNWTNQLHARYGPVVRLSPTEVSVWSSSSIRDVFTGSAKTGYYGKGPIFNIFQHYSARNAFSSISTEAHSWRRKIVAGNYAMSAIVAKEAKYGSIWGSVGKFVELVGREGKTVEGGDAKGGKAVDVFSACRFYAADNISNHLFIDGAHALDGNMTARNFIESSAEGPDDVMTYLRMEFENLHTGLRRLRNIYRRIMGQKVEKAGRVRPGILSGSKLEAAVTEWYGGTEIRDWGFKQFVASRKALEAGSIGTSQEDPVSARLAANAIAADDALTVSDGFGGDNGVRLVKTREQAEPTLFYRNEGCASECMDQMLAGTDTVGDTLSYTLHVLSLPGHTTEQNKLQQECEALSLPTSYNQPLSLEQLNAIQTAPYLEAVLKETLRRYPASTTALQRVVPDGGRVLDGVYVPGGIIIGASPVTTNNDVEVFDRHGKYNVDEWLPQRWLDADSETLAEMNRRLWTFGSGGRGCIGKHLAILEMKLLLAGIYSRFATRVDTTTKLPKPSSHPSQRTTFRDIDWFRDAQGVLSFEKLH